MKFSPNEAPPRYTPFDRGVYEIAPGLRPFGTDFGNGAMDTRVFQIDRDIELYLNNKQNCRDEDIAKYCLFSRFTPEIARAVNQFLIERMLLEYPQIFSQESVPGGCVFRSRLTQDEISLDAKLLLRDPSKFLNTFDALSAQVPEDLAVITLAPDGHSNELTAIQLCAAGHWSPAAKIGRDFFAIHTPVPGIAKINERAQQFAEIMVQKGPFVRFAWGIATDRRLNHHPDAPANIDPAVWHGRSFRDPVRDRLYVRVERQITWGLPQVRSAIFGIRVSYLDAEDIKRDSALCESLKQALRSTTPESRVYKDLVHSLDPILDYLSR